MFLFVMLYMFFLALNFLALLVFQVLNRCHLHIFGRLEPGMCHTFKHRKTTAFRFGFKHRKTSEGMITAGTRDVKTGCTETGVRAETGADSGATTATTTGGNESGGYSGATTTTTGGRDRSDRDGDGWGTARTTRATTTAAAKIPNKQLKRKAKVRLCMH